MGILNKNYDNDFENSNGGLGTYNYEKKTTYETKGQPPKDNSKVDDIEQEINNQENETQDTDSVNHPSHYTQGSVEVIDILEQQANIMAESGVDARAIPSITNALKYLCRFQSKGTAVQDINKAIWYLNRSKQYLD